MVKKGLVLLVAAFAVFYLLSSPVGAADSVRGAFDAVIDAFEQISQFFNRLVG